MKTFFLILIIAVCTSLESCVFTLIGYSIDSSLDKDARTYNETDLRNKYIDLKDLAMIEYREFICIVTKNDSCILGEFIGFDDEKKRKEPLKLSEYKVIKMDEISVPISQIKFVVIPYNKHSQIYAGTIIGVVADLIMLKLIFTYGDPYTWTLNR